MKIHAREKPPEPGKLDAVVSYLEHYFPGAEIAMQYDEVLDAEKIRVDHGNNSYLIKVLDEFLDDSDGAEIPQKLEAFRLAHYMQVIPPDKCIVVSTAGLGRIDRGA